MPSRTRFVKTLIIAKGPFRYSTSKSVAKVASTLEQFPKMFKLRDSNMTFKSASKRKPSIKLTLGTDDRGRCNFELDLALYTFGTFFVVLVIYVVTRGWKGYTAPEEVDLGPVQVSFDRTPTTIIHH